MANSNRLKLDLSRIDDTATRKVFQDIMDAHNRDDLNLCSFRLLTINETAAVTDKELFHNLPFIPQDIIVAKSTGTITFNYSAFTKEKLFYTTTGACIARIFVGSYGDE